MLNTWFSGAVTLEAWPLITLFTCMIKVTALFLTFSTIDIFYLTAMLASCSLDSEHLLCVCMVYDSTVESIRIAFDKVISSCMCFSRFC